MSGLIALVQHYPDVSNKLRVLWNSEEQFVVQALVHAVSHASDLGNEIAALLPHMPRYVADVTATNNEGKFDQESDKTWLISTKTVDLLLKGSWAEINWHDDVMLSLMRWRGERDLRLRWESDEMRRLLEPCPPLVMQRWPERRIHPLRPELSRHNREPPPRTPRRELLPARRSARHR